MKRIKQHPLLFAILGFIFLTIPSAIDAYWSLSEKLSEADMPTLNLGIISWLLPLLGIMLFILVLWQIQKLPKESNNTEEIEQAAIIRKMVNKDNDRPDRCVLVRGIRVKLDHIKDISGPYLVFEFWIFNASILNIIFEKNPSGHLIYEGQEIRDSLEFLPGGFKPTLSRTNAASIELRQFLLPDLANKIMDMPPATTKIARFNFSNIYLPMETTKLDGGIGNIWRCPLPQEVSFQLPPDGTIAFINN
jgi:hypothetical protein